MKRRTKWELRLGFFALISVILVSLLALSNISSFLYSTNILSYPEHKPYDGLVYPVQKVPNWVKLSTDKRSAVYKDLDASDLIDLPEYSPDDLVISTDTLTWGKEKDNKIRNEKITYPVPYMGTYNLDGKEYAGSHPAVDIKIPKGTPIFAIGNGTVIKASNQSSGFGHHIVVMHNNFPSNESENRKTTIYSTYNHLGDLLVNVGDTVTKGQQIALSGDTGTATTPHLHFQIDNDKAPWHPFWPFTYQEAADAGYSFFEAVNYALGADKALETTINPLKYVKKYYNSAVSENTDSIVKADSYVEKVVAQVDKVPEITPEVLPDPIVVTDTPETPKTAEVTSEPEVKVLNFDITVSRTYNVSSPASFYIYLKDQHKNNFRDGFEGELTVSSDRGYFSVSDPILTTFQFSNSKFKEKFSNLKEGKDRVKVIYDNVAYYSDWFEIVTKKTLFSDVTEGNKYYPAIKYLTEKGIVEGYEDNTFKPFNSINRVEALKFILEGTDRKLVSGRLPFKDTDAKQWYAKYIFTGFKNEIVEGDPDGNFRPDDTVNKAEFLKILFNGMDEKISLSVPERPFNDVAVDDWYAPYVYRAKELGIIDSSEKNFNPGATMTRGEVVDAMYRVMKR